MAVAEHNFPDVVIDTLRRRGRVVIPSRGASMTPAIPDGARIEVRPVALDELQVGDVLLYHRDGKCFCHRLIRKEGRHCIVKGDSLLAADPPVPFVAVIGRVSTLFVLEAGAVPLDAPRERRRAAWRARATYLISLLYHLRRAIPRARTR